MIGTEEKRKMIINSSGKSEENNDESRGKIPRNI
jgi:hypothetical protein